MSERVENPGNSDTGVWFCDGCGTWIAEPVSREELVSPKGCGWLVVEDEDDAGGPIEWFYCPECE